jgi:sulfur relay protein TusB/DsrH
MSPEDSLLLIEDAVLLLGNPNLTIDLPAPSRLYALLDDCNARGIQPDASIATPIDFKGFVDLVARHPKSVSWF